MWLGGRCGGRACVWGVRGTCVCVWFGAWVGKGHMCVCICGVGGVCGVCICGVGGVCVWLWGGGA